MPPEPEPVPPEAARDQCCSGDETASLWVVTHRRWVADDLAAGGRVPVRHSLGLDIPAPVMAGAPVWAPMEWAARAVAAGANLRLADPGPGFLCGLPDEALLRPVLVLPLDRVPHDGPPTGFFKPANTKIERLPATFTDRDSFTSAAQAAGLPPDALVLCTPRRLRFAEEHRVWIVDGTPTASSPYLVGTSGPGTGTTWSETMVSVLGADARTFAAHVCTTQTDLPASFVLDVAVLADGPDAGRWVVVEANPTWCAAVYGGDPGPVSEAIVAANAASNRWRWVPDPYLAARVARQRGLRPDDQ